MPPANEGIWASTFHEEGTLASGGLRHGSVVPP